jgi:aspartyl-tRNA(Asn)/glutamyl-tRNA(Gln) amidotransferase subunit A
MGSVRLPAAYCGCVGLKPSYGLVSNRGVTPACDPLDHVGPLARTVGDAALVLSALAAGDAEWPGSAVPPAEWSPLPAELPDLCGYRIGVVGAFERFACEPAVRQGFGDAMHRLRTLGATVVNCDLQGYEPTAARRSGLLWVEATAAAVHEQDLVRHPAAYPAGIRAMLDYGQTLPAPRLVRALERVRAIATGFTHLLDTVDLLAMPTAPQLAFEFAQAVPPTQAEFCAPANFAGLPAIALPSGLDNGLPTSLQLVGRKFGEAKLLSIARVYERAVEFKAAPPLD